MLKVVRLLRRLRYLLRQREAEADLAEEIEFHRLMMGESRRSDLGNVTLAREDARAVWIWPWLESLWQDVAYAVRDLRRNPGFTTTALLVLGVAIGVNVSLFTTFRTVVYQPWPVKEPEAVAQIMIRMPDGSLFGEAFRPIEYRLVAPHARSFSGLAHPLGESIRFGGAKYEIIGVARNADTEAAALRLERVQPLIYHPSIRGRSIGCRNCSSKAAPPRGCSH